MALLVTRRDIAMLGLVHRAAFRKGPPQFWEFFPKAPDTTRVRVRFSHRRHTEQLVETRSGKFLELVRRSALGLVAVYKLFPGDVVATDSVKELEVKTV